MRKTQREKKTIIMTITSEKTEKTWCYKFEIINNNNHNKKEKEREAERRGYGEIQ